MEQNHKSETDASQTTSARLATSAPQNPITSLSEEWTFPLLQQAIVMILAGMVLDGGRIFQMCFYAMVAYWGGIFMMSRRRKKAYTRVDLLLVRYAFIPLCVISGYLTSWIWHLRGY